MVGCEDIGLIADELTTSLEIVVGGCCAVDVVDAVVVVVAVVIVGVGVDVVDDSGDEFVVVGIVIVV